MADESENLVSQVSVTGTEEAAAKLGAYADAGAKSFEKLNASAATAAAGVTASAAEMEAAAKKGGAAFQAFGQGSSRSIELQNSLTGLQKALGNLSASFQPLTQAAGRFAARMALSAAGVVAAGAKIASSASEVSKTLGSQTTAFEQNAQAQERATDTALQSRIGTINLESSQRQLFKQFQKGEITFSEYSKSLKKLNEDYKEQQRVTRQTEAATESARLENERLKKSVEDRKALDGLIDKFGGPLTTSLGAFGTQLTGIKRNFLDAFGPGVASLVDLISATISKNAGAIQGFFTEAGTKLQQLISTQGPQLQKFFENIGKAASSVFIGLIEAAPGVIDFVNNKLVPAISKISSVLNGIAAAFNGVFGTNLSAGGIVVIAIFAQMTGAIRLLFALLKAGKGVTKAFFGVFNSAAGIIDAIFGTKATGKVVGFTTKLAGASGPVRAFIVIVQSLIPVISGLAAVLATTFGVPFGVALAAVIALTVALGFLATKVDWKAVGAAIGKFATDTIKFFDDTAKNGGRVVQFLQDKWQGLKDFFSELGSSIGGFFSNAWEAIKSAGATAAQNVQENWAATKQFFSDLGTSISDAVVGAWELIKSGATAASAFVVQAWETVKQFFTDFWTNLSLIFSTGWTTIQTGVQAAIKIVQDLWLAVVTWFDENVIQPIVKFFTDLGTQISDAFKTGIDKVKQFFTDLGIWAQQKLQPILDILKAIKDLIGSVTGGGDSTTPVTAARGGYIRGPGSSTSDSIPALLSDKEYVIKAKSVAKYGTGLLAAINSGRYKMPKFALGGLVSRAMAPNVPRLAFAGGGPVDGRNMRPLTLNLMGETFSGLLAPEDVGERLGKFAVSKQTRSGGRKPDWVGRGRR